MSLPKIAICQQIKNQHADAKIGRIFCINGILYKLLVLSSVQRNPFSSGTTICGQIRLQENEKQNHNETEKKCACVCVYVYVSICNVTNMTMLQTNNNGKSGPLGVIMY